jgi:uncharacterized MAPEG superfamily protein
MRAREDLFMTTPLWCLVIVAILPYVLAPLGGYFRIQQFKGLDNKHPRIQQAKMEGIGARALVAQQNAWEALAFFTAAVVVSHFTQADPGTASKLSVGFLVTRILHPVLYLANIDTLRSLVFLVGLGCGFGLFWISCH